MRLCSMLLCCTLIAATPLIAESKNPADYPLRLHVFPHDQTAFYHNRNADEFKGDGRANLFSNGDVHAVDFTYDCSEKLRASFGYETCRSLARQTPTSLATSRLTSRTPLTSPTMADWAPSRQHSSRPGW
jgi:hypothetical protein